MKREASDSSADNGVYLRTERLVLRSWRKEDLEPFAALNADLRVREYFFRVLSPEESDNEVKTFFQAHFDKYGWGPWAVSLADTEEFIGFIGLEHVPFNSHFTPAIEVGWRLAFAHWGKGYATEGALAALGYGFDTLHIKEIVAYTAVQNQRSRRVMEKLGMHHQRQDDFDHPAVPEGHPMRRHVLYRLRAEEWVPKGTTKA